MIELLIKKNKDFLLEEKSFRSYNKELERLVDEINKNKIVILSGLRHTGKTKLIAELIKKTENSENVFYCNAERDKLGLIENEQDIMTLMDIYVRAHGIPKIIILQNMSGIDGIKTFIRKLYKAGKYKIIIVGNNIKIEGVTNIELFPLGINEKNLNLYQYGGIPQLRIIPDIAYKNFLLEALTHDIISRDILEAYNIKNIRLFYKLIYYLATQTQYESHREIHRNLKHHGVEISLVTLADYISAGVNTHLLHKEYLYDIKAKKYITSRAKYFFGDLGIRYGFAGKDISYLENAVYLELRSRGYQVSGAIRGRFEFEIFAAGIARSFAIVLGTSGEDKNAIRKKARKLAKVDSKSSKFVIVENRENLHIRKFEEDGVKIIELGEFIRELD